MSIDPDVEQKLWTAAGVSQITDIAGFPLASHDSLKAAVTSGEVQLGIEFAAARDLVRITKSPSAALLTLALAFVMPLLAISSLILAFATGNWWTLGGIASSILGQMLANPYNPIKSLVKLLVAGALIHVVANQSIIEGATWASFSFIVSAVALWTLNRLAWKWAKEAALASEALAAHLFKTGNLNIQDNNGKIHSVQREK